MIDTNRRPEPLEDQKVYLLVELTILPGFLEEVKAILKQALVPTLQEPGCEGLFETARNDDPHKLVFFEVFSSATAHEFHLALDVVNPNPEHKNSKVRVQIAAGNSRNPPSPSTSWSMNGPESAGAHSLSN